MNRRATAAILDAAYRGAPTEQAWLEGLVEAARPLDQGGGLIAYTVDLKGSPRIASAAMSADFDPAMHRALAANTSQFDLAFARAIYSPTEFAGNTMWRFERLLEERAIDKAALAERAGEPLPALWLVLSGNPDQRAVALGFGPREKIGKDVGFPDRARARQLGLVGAHIGAALRLRSTTSQTITDTDAADAIFDDRGRLVHASRLAKESRTTLTDAILACEKARARDLPEDEALALWQALVDGKWSIVRVEERDGKRFVLARKNPIGSRDVTALDQSERDVAWLTAMGHTTEFIAYELGLSVPVATHALTSALEKLGMKSRRELAKFFSGVLPRRA